MTSSKLCPVSMCISGKGKRPGRNAFSARRNSTTESLPPEKSRTGRSHSAATSPKMKMASDSSQSRCVLDDRSPIFFHLHKSDIAFMQAALFGRGLFPPPAAGARVLSGPDRARTGIAAYGGIALVVQRVVRNIVGANYGPHLGVGPGCEGVVLMQAECPVVLGLLQVGPGHGLVAMLAGQPGAMARQDAAQRLDLAD